MASYFESVKTQSLKKGIGAAMIVADGPVGIRLKYKGSGTVTSVTVTTATNIVIVTSDGGTDTYAFSTYSTVGALQQAINSSGVFEAKVLDALRADSTASQFVDGAISISTAGYYDVAVDTSAAKSLTYRCAYDRNVGSDVDPGNHRVSLKEFTYYATLGAAAANGVQVWEYNRNDNTEVQLYQELSVSATVTTINFANGYSEITSGDNNDLILRIKDGTSLADANAYLQLQYARE